MVSRRYNKKLKGEMRKPSLAKVNPAVSGNQYRLAQTVLDGKSDLIPVSVAREIVDSTPKWLRSKYMKERTENMGRRGSRQRNSSGTLEESTELTEGFHGRKAEYVEDILEIEKYRKNLAHLGDLVEFEILCRNGKQVTPINFADHDSDEHVSVGGTPDRQQIILSGGNQSIDLDSFFEISDTEKRKDYVRVGEIYSISYFTDKHHLTGPKYQKDGTEYIHVFGEEEEGERPELVYDRLNQRMMIIGGSYEIRDEGIWN